MRGAGTAAINMCLVASGCVEAYYEIGMHVWDLAAGSLIVSEAGGVLLDVEGKEAQTAADNGDVEPRRLSFKMCVVLVFRRGAGPDVPENHRGQQQNHRAEDRQRDLCFQPGQRRRALTAMTPCSVFKNRNSCFGLFNVILLFFRT